MGESAGGVDIVALAAAPAAKGLFTRAIIESAGMGWRPTPSLARAQAAGEKALAPLLSAAATPASLRALPADALVKAGHGNDAGPVVDRVTLRADPLEAWRQRGSGVSVLIGSNSGEGSILPPDDKPQEIAATLTPANLAALRAAYGEAAARDGDFARLLFRDIYFARPARWLARNAGAPAYLYRFDYVLTSLRTRRSDAHHGSEIPLTFETWSGRTTDADSRMIKLMHGCWVSFAIGGRPSCGLSEWSGYGQGKSMMLSDRPGLSAEPAPDILDRMLQPPR